jgi:hypothetical protein
VVHNKTPSFIPRGSAAAAPPAESHMNVVDDGAPAGAAAAAAAAGGGDDGPGTKKKGVPSVFEKLLVKTTFEEAHSFVEPKKGPKNVHVPSKMLLLGIQRSVAQAAAQSSRANGYRRASASIKISG